ncbi:STAS domain-containing protein [Streptomyces aidingensis]|uniref:Anti-sigma factor antagonist n=1 Tax=Streptomyces aidingensis TaxID=910347 RepID=A0A1I1GMR3_9ACTN|nr:STAS domain-containing protein [Streptomyces aidingensis]SFC12801.1 anti-anti-sigma factor [Streptomyces aidingensis]
MDRGGQPESAHRRRFTVDARRLPPIAVVEPQGELDHHSAEMLRVSLHACVTGGCPWIVVDCARLDFCDSTGLNALLAARLEAEAAGGGVHLAAPQPRVARLLEITGAGMVFTLHDSLAAALAAVPGNRA